MIFAVPLVDKYYRKCNQSHIPHLGLYHQSLLAPDRDGCQSDYILSATHFFPTTLHLAFEHHWELVDLRKYGPENAAFTLFGINGLVAIF